VPESCPIECEKDCASVFFLLAGFPFHHSTNDIQKLKKHSISVQRKLMEGNNLAPEASDIPSSSEFLVTQARADCRHSRPMAGHLESSELQQPQHTD